MTKYIKEFIEGFDRGGGGGYFFILTDNTIHLHKQDLNIYVLN